MTRLMEDWLNRISSFEASSRSERRLSSETTRFAPADGRAHQARRHLLTRIRDSATGRRESGRSCAAPHPA